MGQDDIVDTDLLALADDDESDSEGEIDTKQDSRDQSRVDTPPNPSPPASKSRTTAIAQRPAPKKRQSTSRRQRDDDSEDDGEASSAGSMGSAAMSESESDREAPAAPADGPVYPVDGKYTSVAERSKVMAMSEIEREDFLAKRMEEVQDVQKSLALKNYFQGRSKSSTGQADKSDKKRKADISQLDRDETPRKRSTAKSKQHEAIAGYKKIRERAAEERRRGDAHRSRESRSPSDRNRYSDDDAEGESEVEWDDKPRQPAPVVRNEPPAQIRDYSKIRVGRSNFAKVCYYPGFEDAIRGCFCRVAIGMNRQTGENTYRMTQIKGFVEGREYQMEYNNRPFKCNLYAVLAHGKAEKEWPFTNCSDGDFQMTEYDRYQETLQSEALRAPTPSLIRQKCVAIQALLDHQFSNDEINEQLRRRGWLPAQQAAAEDEAKRARLLVTRAQALEDDDLDLVEDLDAQIAALGGDLLNPARPVTVNNAVNVAPLSTKTALTAAPAAPTQQERLAALNRANRKLNAEEVRRAQMADRRRNAALQSAVVRGEAVPDAFARVKTRPKTHYNVEEEKKVEERKVGDVVNGGGAIGKKAGGKVGGKRLMDDEVVAALDLEIDVEI